MFFSAPSYDPDRDMPSQSGKIFIVTGGNTGLGYESILTFVKKDAKVYMASRTESKALAAIDKIKALVPGADLHFLPLDLTSFASIRSFAASYIARESKIDVLLNNAGVMALPYSETKEGHEIQFGTNHLGHYYLTRLLLPTIVATPNSRIVNLTSAGHGIAFRGLPTLPDPTTPGYATTLAKDLERRNTYERYGISKLANLQHAKSLSQKYPGVLCVSCHPGIIITDLYNTFNEGGRLATAMTKLTKSVTMTLEQGCYSEVWCATIEEPEKPENGRYYTPVGRVPGWCDYAGETKWAKNLDEAERLWVWSEGVVTEWEKANPEKK